MPFHDHMARLSLVENLLALKEMMENAPALAYYSLKESMNPHHTVGSNDMKSTHKKQGHLLLR